LLGAAEGRVEPANLLDLVGEHVDRSQRPIPRRALCVDNKHRAVRPRALEREPWTRRAVEMVEDGVDPARGRRRGRSRDGRLDGRLALLGCAACAGHDRRSTLDLRARRLRLRRWRDDATDRIHEPREVLPGDARKALLGANGPEMLQVAAGAHAHRDVVDQRVPRGVQHDAQVVLSLAIPEHQRVPVTLHRPLNLEEGPVDLEAARVHERRPAHPGVLDPFPAFTVLHISGHGGG
jgi:hypothetical protein